MRPTTVAVNQNGLILAPSAHLSPPLPPSSSLPLCDKLKFRNSVRLLECMDVCAAAFGPKATLSLNIFVGRLFFHLDFNNIYFGIIMVHFL